MHAWQKREDLGRALTTLWGTQTVTQVTTSARPSHLKEAIGGLRIERQKEKPCPPDSDGGAGVGSNKELGTGSPAHQQGGALETCEPKQVTPRLVFKSSL